MDDSHGATVVNVVMTAYITVPIYLFRLHRPAHKAHSLTKTIATRVRLPALNYATEFTSNECFYRVRR